MSVTARYAHRARLCVMPHADNDYHPALLRHKPLAIVSALLVSAKMLALMLVVLLPHTAELSTITAARIVQQTNAEREKAGLEPLAVNEKLTNAAQQKGEHMLKEDYFAHISPSGVTPWFWMNKAGYAYQVAGENLAIDFAESEEVVKAWLASPTHKENMLLPSYTETGVAVVTGEFQGGTSTIVVHMFGLSSTATAAVAPATTQAPQAAVEPSHAPAATPTPTPLPADTVPPTPPVIRLEPGTTATDSAVILIQAEEGASIRFVVNGNETSLTAKQSGAEIRVPVPLRDYPDGQIIVEATAQDAAGNVSGRSNGLAVAKDTSGPRIDEEGLKFVLAFQTDYPKWWLVWDGDADVKRAMWRTGSETYEVSPGGKTLVPFSQEAVSLSLFDERGNESVVKTIALAPAYHHEADQQFMAAPARFNRATRILATSIFLTILTLLSLAVVIHIRVQRPALIAHASLVLLLAAVLILW